MVLRNAKDALLDSTDESRLKGLAPPTPPQLSPVKPRRACAAHPVAPSLPDVAALTAELHRLVNGDGECSPGDRPEGRASAAWESLPLDLWDVVWHDHLDLPARMAFCLTNTTCVPSACPALTHYGFNFAMSSLACIACRPPHSRYRTAAFRCAGLSCLGL